MNVFLMFVQVQDIIPFSIGLLSDDGPISAGSDGVLFPRGHTIPSITFVTSWRTNLFHWEAFYVDLKELPPGTSSKISYFTVCPH